MAATLSWRDMTKSLMPSGRSWLPENTLSLSYAQLWQRQNQVLKQNYYALSFLCQRLMWLSNMQSGVILQVYLSLAWLAELLIKHLLIVAAVYHTLTAALQSKRAQP